MTAFGTKPLTILAAEVDEIEIEDQVLEKGRVKIHAVFPNHEILIVFLVLQLCGKCAAEGMIKDTLDLFHTARTGCDIGHRGACLQGDVACVVTDDAFDRDLLGKFDSVKAFKGRELVVKFDGVGLARQDRFEINIHPFFTSMPIFAKCHNWYYTEFNPLCQVFFQSFMSKFSAYFDKIGGFCTKNSMRRDAWLLILLCLAFRGCDDTLVSYFFEVRYLFKTASVNCGDAEKKISLKIGYVMALIFVEDIVQRALVDPNTGNRIGRNVQVGFAEEK